MVGTSNFELPLDHGPGVLVQAALASTMLIDTLPGSAEIYAPQVRTLSSILQY